MDHIPLPGEGDDHADIPYLAQAIPFLSYGYQGLEGFPERKGFNFHSLRRHDAATDFAEHAAVF